MNKDDVLKIIDGRTYYYTDYVYYLYDELKKRDEIIKEVREYIKNHREAVDERGEHIIYFLKDDFDEEDILEILDKVDKE